MFFLSERLFGWVQWFSRRELLPKGRHFLCVLYCPRVRESKATQTVPGTGTDQEAVRGLTTTTTQLSSLRSTIRRSNTSAVAKLLPCYYLLIYICTYEDES
jgi:hypothetical protein